MTETVTVNLATPTHYGFDRFSAVRQAFCPSFSKDGETLAFVSDITGVPQVWSYQFNSRRLDQLTLFDHRVSSAHFSPRGDGIVFSMDPGGNEKHQIWILELPNLETRKLSKFDDVIYNFGAFSPDGKEILYASNERDERHFDIYTQSVQTLESKLLHKSDHHNFPVDWITNNRMIIGRANTNLDNDLFLINQGSTEPTRLTAHRDEATFDYSGHSSDSKSIFVITNVDREFSQPALLDLATRRLTILSEEKWDAVGARISPNGRHLAYFRNEDGVSKLHILDLETSSDSKIEGLPQGVLEAPLIAGHDLVDWDAKSQRLVFSLQGPKHNLNIWQCDLTSRKVSQLTFVPTGGIPPDAFIEPRHETYSSFDGLKIPVLVYEPKDRKGPMPTVVFVHGGPESQEKARFNIIVQYLANHGFLVLAPNVRGSSGYGKHWIHLDDVEKRLDSVKDLDYLVKWAIETGLSQKGRVGVVGGSYGGFMVLSAITEFPNVWGAAVDMVGIANFSTFLERTAKWRRHLRTPEYGDPERHAELFKRISPIHHVDKITSPLLVIHGANDPRVPIHEAEQIVARLKELGRRVEFIRFEDEGHGIAKIPNRIRAY
ncbi:MAG TPA: alpha/beta fold hydrolase, partial [Candidatus Bathyarchaeia archaeon]|nr:alpha/beta fold hydrolase [Candidatus Bathyarchaeia archaeon]